MDEQGWIEGSLKFSDCIIVNKAARSKPTSATTYYGIQQ
jgi:hypothetical protein